MSSYTASPIDRVVYGQPAATVVAEESAGLGAERVFLMVSRTLNRETTWVADIRSALGNRYAGQFDGMPSHTPRDAVLRATDQARDAHADLIVTFGGGSITDAGKMVRLALRLDIRDVAGFDPYVVRVHPDGSRTFPVHEGPTIAQIAVPTTLSAGDFNPVAGATDTRSGLKELYVRPTMVPRVVVLDPAVTVRTPQWLWLSTGIRALDHAVEAVCSLQSDRRSQVEAIETIRLLSSALPATAQNPDDLAARQDAQLAMWLSMEHHRFGVSKGASHGIGHVLGGTCDVPHGYTSCVMLPYVMRWNEPANADRQALVAAAMGRPGKPAWEVLDAFIGGLGMPRTLAAVGVGADKFDTIARAAMLDHYLHTNPRPVSGVDDVLEILRTAA